MRIVGFRDGKRTIVGPLVDGTDGPAVVPLAPVEDFYADLPAWKARAGQTLGDQADARPVAALTLAPPIPPAARVLCVGLNYRAHAAETGIEPPRYPNLFGRWTVSLTVDGTPAPVPAGERGLDWEGELGVVVGVSLADVDEVEALAGVFGYAAFNDLSARRSQGRSPLWTVGKNADYSGPLGPVVTADEVGDPADGLRGRAPNPPPPAARRPGAEGGPARGGRGPGARVGGGLPPTRTRADDGSTVEEVVQDGDTRDMIFTVGQVLAYLSRTLTLHPGDLLVTGTPAGVGYSRTPPRYLVPGDWVRVDIDRVGSVATPIVDAAGRG
ncbi:fumarylacetoacetate hydrolase family protein [Frankia sp. AgB1.8]|uniref:fumarylacetoacetate hydrolase family protein n=1 Tax=Frankia sp. AgB1.8 TaxID=2792839 RepID=UPI001933E03F|nr:fumarylacetoacetate hydrolase family protein [Frankia sp. AgB1.8]MBL7618857.1 fumarylacetoacetate hydrolase family protein [Frankia sp. AgB1.8]